MKIEHIALYVNDLEAAKDFFVRYFDAVPNAGYHSSRLTARRKADGCEVLSGPRTTGDGYYESCVLAVEGNQIEITV